MMIPRILLADSDSQYILPLQQRFAETFGNAIFLEIIDDADYLQRLFETPQKADVLVIDEKLYSPAMRLHNIEKTFLLCEEEQGSAERNVTRIPKYASIFEVFNRISSAIHPADEKKETHVLAVGSAAGGTGKTTIALGICGFLARCGKKVLYINSSRLQCFQAAFENKSVLDTQEIYSRLMNPGKNLYQEIRQAIRHGDFAYLPPFKMALLSLGFSPSVFCRIVASAKSSGEYDYILVDMDASLDETTASLMGAADKVILVTGQGRNAAFATSRLAAEINGANSEKFIFLCGNYRKGEYNAFVDADGKPPFTVDEFIEHFDGFDGMRCEDYAKKESIQRAALLVM